MKRKQVLQVVLGLAIGLALAACSGGGGGGGNNPQGITINAFDTFKYDPPAITAKVGQPVNITLDNKGVLIHTFILDEFGAKLENVQGGATGQVSFTPTQAGTYTFYCNVAGHKEAGMTGTLTVNP